jgi:hypothetical protein
MHQLKIAGCRFPALRFSLQRTFLFDTPRTLSRNNFGIRCNQPRSLDSLLYERSYTPWPFF